MRSRARANCSCEIVVVVTRQPVVCAAVVAQERVRRLDGVDVARRDRPIDQVWPGSRSGAQVRAGFQRRTVCDEHRHDRLARVLDERARAGLVDFG